MSKPIDDGGPAFPAGNDANLNETMGMSLRDWFAGQAMKQLIAHKESIMANKPELRDIAMDCEMCVAQAAYLQADAMLAARKATPTIS